MHDPYKQSFKKSSPENAELSVYNCGLQSCESSYFWGPGVRDHYLIHLVTKGRGTYQVSGQTHPLAAGDIFLAKPSQLVYYAADAHDPWEYYWVGFNGAGAARLVQQLPFTDDAPCHRDDAPAQSRELLHNIYLAGGYEVYDEARMVGCLYLFLAHLMQQAKQEAKRPPDTSAQYVINAIKYIQFNYARDIGINDVAAAVGISRSHLYRVFVNSIGRSPVEYLTDFRISEACALLETTTLSVAEIANSVGFFDQFYFSRVFKKAKGVPPSRYLQKIPSGEPHDLST